MRYEFVEYVPDRLEPGTIYVAIEHDVAVHLCACGCGHEVVTPFSPAQWSITYDGQGVSLHPSIGNWGFPCKSHYWIRRGRVEWARRFSAAEIEAVRREDAVDQERVFDPAATEPLVVPTRRRAGWLRRLIRFVVGLGRD